MKCPCLKLHFKTKAFVASTHACSSSGTHQLSKVSFGRLLGKLGVVKVSKVSDTVLHHILVSYVFSLEAEQPDGKISGGVVCLRGC